ncbi:hypothetical protein [Tardiphaga sp.]|uniref:hypothetical protein n=1 Tax=Tardiphaga sp. TaxID=1926292 RepID=UPI00260AC938|nr:hypothetical protein [Tardiphaga sp.]MDB5617505.1 hypothetical protein [Tardiphaga sp.]
MADLAFFLWGWLLGAAVLGFCMGWIAVITRSRPVPKRWVQRLAVLAAVIVGVALARLVPGRFGYWLDLGLALFTCYLVGCAIGSWLRDWVVSRQSPAA